VDAVIRHAQPSDYGRVIARVNVWWGGREMEPMLPRLFFVHFEGTSYVAERPEDGELVGFLCGFLSQTKADEAYIHFIGVAPEARGLGLGRGLYERFFDEVRAHGRSVVRCVTSPENADSVAFHSELGFEVEETIEDYDGEGRSRVLLAKRL
jgi:ribosomal protein S18 acetylase RimI-like enzyme